MSDSADEKEESFKNIVFITSIVAWGGGTLFSFFLSFLSLPPWKTLAIVIIALLTTGIYVYFSARKKKRSGWKKDCSQMVIPNFVAVILAIIILFNSFVGFHAEEFLRKHHYAGELEYSGIESSIDENIKDSGAKKTFEEKKIKIAKGKSKDKDFLIGCWFKLRPPEKSSQGCYTKIIEIRIKNNKYGRIWDLFYPVYHLTDGFKAEAENIPPYDVDGILKYGYKLNITCIRPGQEYKVLLVLGKKEDSVLPFKTWKYAISIRFKDK